MMTFGKHVPVKEIDPNLDYEISMDGADTKYTAHAPTILYDEQMILSNGEILLVDDSDQPERAICDHTFESVKYTTHQRNSSGGCTIKEYSADRCTKCDTLKNVTLIIEHTFPVCPH